MRKEEISYTDRMKYEFLGLWRSAEKEVNILCTMKRRETNWISNTLHNNCLLRHVIEGKKVEKRREDVDSYWMNLREREDTGFQILWTVHRDKFA